MMGSRKPKRQVIVAFFTGVKDEDIHAMERWLTQRAEEKGVKSHSLCLGPDDSTSDYLQTADEIQPILDNKVPKLEANDRIYLIGHGNWRQQTIGGCGVRSVAKIFSQWNLPQYILISILGCSLARDDDSEGYGLLAHSIDSFASNLHKRLKDKYKIRTIVYARVQHVGMSGTEQVGRKGVYLKKTHVEKGKIAYRHDRSKVRFWWKGDLQMRAWVNYTTGELDPIDG